MRATHNLGCARFVLWLLARLVVDVDGVGVGIGISGVITGGDAQHGGKWVVMRSGGVGVTCRLRHSMRNLAVASRTSSGSRYAYLVH